MVGGRNFECTGNIFGGYGLDGIVYGDPQDVGGTKGGEKKERRNTENSSPPSAAKAAIDFMTLTARLKPRPFKTFYETHG